MLKVRALPHPTHLALLIPTADFKKNKPKTNETKKTPKLTAMIY